MFRTAILSVTLSFCSFNVLPVAAVLATSQHAHRSRQHTAHNSTHASAHHSSHHSGLGAGHKMKTHHRALHKSHRSKTHRQGVTKEDRLSMADALGHLPTAISNSFAKFQDGPSASTAGNVVELLNRAYLKALTDKDTLSLACQERKAGYIGEIHEAKGGLTDMDKHFNELMKREEALQATMDRSLAEVEMLRTQWDEHRKSCAQSKDHMVLDLKALQMDLPLALALMQKVTASCGPMGGTLPGLVECVLPDDSYVTTFKDAQTRIEVAALSGLAEKFVALNLERAVQGTSAKGPAAALLQTLSVGSGSPFSAKVFLQKRTSHGKLRTTLNATVHHKKHHERRHHVKQPVSFLQRGTRHGHHRAHRALANKTTHRGHGKRRSRKGASLIQTRSSPGNATHSQRRHPRASSLLQTLLRKAELPTELCGSVLTPPSCASFSDNMHTLLGNIEDLILELKQRAADEEQHCQDSFEIYDTKIRDLKRQSSDAGVALSNTVSERSELAAMRRAKRMQVRDVTQEVREDVGDCHSQLTELEAQLCSAKRVNKEIDQGGDFAGDCEVSEWLKGQCSKPCGEGGVQNFTRKVLSGQSEKCPPLLLSSSCNTKPCPTNGQMSEWGEWTQCSRACSTGTRFRHRTVLQYPQNGGRPVSKTTEDESCNDQPCDQDCQLSDWGEWSGCSKQCSTGHRARARRVMQQALGEGSCPEEHDPQREQTEGCNVIACNATKLQQCAVALDLALLLDSSGSIGAEGFEKSKAFATRLIGRIQLDGEIDDGATVGLLTFAKETAVVTGLSYTRSTITAALEGVAWAKTGTNTVKALSKARDMFETAGRQGVPSVAVVITDGFPARATLMATEISRLKAHGVRLIFVTVGPAVNRKAAEQWVSWPPNENLITVPDFAGLDDAVGTELLSNLCRKLS